MANFQPSGGQANPIFESQGGQAMTSDNKSNDNSTDGSQAIVKKKRDNVRFKVNSAGVPRCGICSKKRIMGYRTKNRFHRHFSSKLCRECAGARVDNSNRRTFCPTCKKIHGMQPQQRLKICVASSLLHEFWTLGGPNTIYEGDSCHIDYLTIPGARINDLTVAWEIQYGNDPRPMDVILVGGLENLSRGYPVDSVMRAFEHFVRLVKWQGKKFHPGVKNTCAIATIPYAPKICWLSNAPTPPNFNDRVESVKRVNAMVEELNWRSGIKVPNFTTFGIRNMVKGGILKNLHRHSHWQEDQLNLNDMHRLKMGKQVVKYFLHETEG